MKNIFKGVLLLLVLLSSQQVQAQNLEDNYGVGSRLWFLDLGAGASEHHSFGSILIGHFAIGHAVDVTPVVQIGGGIMVRNERLVSEAVSTSFPLFAQVQLHSSPSKIGSPFFRFRFGYVPILNTNTTYPLLSFDVGGRFKGRHYSGLQAGLRLIYQNNGYLYQSNYIGAFVQWDLYSKR